MSTNASIISMKLTSTVVALCLLVGLEASARTFISGVMDYANHFSSSSGGLSLSKDTTLFDQSNNHYIILSKTTSAKDFRLYITDTDFNIIKVLRIDQFYTNLGLNISNFFLYPATSQENSEDRLILDTNLGVISLDLDTLKAKHHILQPGFYDTNFGTLETIPRIELNKASTIKLPGA